jgi:hypothetical protein
MSKPNTTPTLPQVLAAQFAEAMRNTYVALPARVESYDRAKQSCSVQPLIKGTKPAEDGTRQPERDPVITNVPVVFPGAGGYSITFPLEPGDTVLLVFSSRSLARWLAVGGEVEPGDERRQHINDAIAIPGLRPFSDPIQSGGVDDDNLIIRADGEIVADSGANAIRLGSALASARIARDIDLQVLEAIIQTCPDGLGFGTALKAALTSNGWPNCQSKVRAD